MSNITQGREKGKGWIVLGRGGTCQTARPRWDTLTGDFLDSLPLDRVRVEIRALDRNYDDYVYSFDYMGEVDPDKPHLDGGVGGLRVSLHH